MSEIKVGDDVDVKGDTQDYILTEPEKIYRGKVVGNDNGQVLVRLKEPVVRGTMEFHEATVHESRVRKH